MELSLDSVRKLTLLFCCSFNHCFTTDHIAVELFIWLFSGVCADSAESHSFVIAMLGFNLLFSKLDTKNLQTFQNYSLLSENKLFNFSIKNRLMMMSFILQFCTIFNWFFFSKFKRKVLII